MSWRSRRRLTCIDFSLRTLAIRPPFERREVTIQPGASIYCHDEWADAIVVVEDGQVELVGRHGATLRVRRGGVLWLSGVMLLRNPGPDPVVISSVRRSRT